MGMGDRPLPVREDDRSLVLATGAVLWEQLDPLRRICLHDDALLTPAPRNRDPVVRAHGTNRTDALADDAGISRVAVDAQAPRPRVPGDAAVAEIEAEEIRVGRGRQRRDHVHLILGTCRGSAAEPAPHRCT